ncbi:MAG TPA: hypothetical protein VGN26_03050 [Armatimonadota bacterium]|jgi:hypothetical protein
MVGGQRGEARQWNPEPVVTLVLKVVQAVAVVAGLYLLFGAVFGGLSDLQERLSLRAQGRVLANVHLAARLFLGCGMVSGVLLGLRFYRESVLVASCLVAGAVLGLGVPYLLVPSEMSALATAAAVRHGAGQPLALVIFAFRHLGMFLLAEGILLALWNAYDRIQARVVRPPAHAPDATTVSGFRLISKCWDTPPRRAALCATCPALRDRTPCWKRLSGCYCDATIAQLAVQARGQYQGQVAGTQPAAQAQRRIIECGECPIYLFHQRQKYNVAVPVVVALGLVVLYFVMPHLGFAYDLLVSSVDHQAARLSFEPIRGSVPRNTQTALDQLGARWLLGISLGALFIAYLIQLVDHLIFTRKL